MLLVQVVGVLIICTIVATEVITFKPFVKSRYSVRDRTKATTKSPLQKANETAVSPNPEATNQEYGSTKYMDPGQQSATTVMTPSEENSKKLSNSNGDQPPIITSSSTTPKKSVNDVSLMNDVKTTISPETTTQAEWAYDYYVSDDEGPKKK